MFSNFLELKVAKQLLSNLTKYSKCKMHSLGQPLSVYSWKLQFRRCKEIIKKTYETK